MAEEWPQLEYSLSEVKKAGKLLRDAERYILTVSEDEVAWASVVLNNFRRAHAEAENWAQMGLRSRLGTLDIDGAVTQRRKERPTIIRKLIRGAPRQQLSTMQDIAGARAVVPTLTDVRRLQERWHENASERITDEYDYIDERPSSGYRAVHLVFKHKERLVEVQLRTRLQQQWADLVEDLGARTGTSLKNSEGDPVILAHLAELADILHEVDRDPTMTDEVRAKAQLLLANLRERVRLGGGTA